MAQFGGQKNPPWATQFATTAVSQPGHSGQSLDLNSLHCEYVKPEALDGFISSLVECTVTQTFNVVLFYLYELFNLCHHHYINIPHSVYFSTPPRIWIWILFCLSAALGVQQPSLLGASPSVYSQQSALAAVSLSNQSAANYQLSQQTAALQQQAAAAAAAALQQVSHADGVLSILCICPRSHVTLSDQLLSLPCSLLFM